MSTRKSDPGQRSLGTEHLVPKVMIALVLMSRIVAAAPDPARLYNDLERHLQSIRSLEIRYEAAVDLSEERIIGRMILLRPDRLYHDTPEWTLCVNGEEQWRFLKPQSTVILERADRTSGWQPDVVLFELKRNFKALSAEQREGGRRILHLGSKDPNLAATAELEFPQTGVIPDYITIAPPDGESSVRYRIRDWNEGIVVDDSLFAPPRVPSENVIDFRVAEPVR